MTLCIYVHTYKSNPSKLLCTYTLIEYVFDYTSFITLILLYQEQPPTDDTIFFSSFYFFAVSFVFQYTQCRIHFFSFFLFFFFLNFIIDLYDVLFLVSFTLNSLSMCRKSLNRWWCSVNLACAYSCIKFYAFSVTNYALNYFFH